MKIYFEQNFWGSRENGPLGIPQKVDLKFTYDSQQYQIPMIYLFPEGITIDIFSQLDTEKIKNFEEKCKNRENNISEEERLCLEAVHPIPEFPLDKIYINNELVQTISRCSACYIAGMDSNEQDDALREMQREYDFIKGKDISFQCIRAHVKFLKTPQKEINTLKFITSKTEVLLPVKKHFMIEVGLPEKEYIVEFIHPLNGIKHHVYINEVKEFNAREQFQQYIPNNPFHYARISYELEPPLSQDERLFIREIRQPDEVVSAGGEKTIIGRACGAIGIIGKSDTELGAHGYPLETIFTNMYWKSLKDIEMSIVGIYKEKCAEEEIVVYDLAEDKI